MTEELGTHGGEHSSEVARLPRKRAPAKPCNKKSKRPWQGSQDRKQSMEENITVITTATSNSSSRGRNSTRSKQATAEAESDKQKDKLTKKSLQRKVLNKTEKISVVHHLSSLDNTTLSMLSMVGVANQLPLPCDDLKDFCDSLSVKDIEFFTEHFKKRFVILYEEYATRSAAISL